MCWLSQYCRIMHVNVSEGKKKEKKGYWKGSNNPTNKHTYCGERLFFPHFLFIQKVFTWLIIWTPAWVCELLLTTGAQCHSSVKKSESKSAKKPNKPGWLRGCPALGKIHFHSSWMSSDYVCLFAHSFIYSSNIYYMQSSVLLIWFY